MPTDQGAPQEAQGITTTDQETATVPQASSVDAVREAIRWMYRATYLEAALRRTGHSPERQDHHAQICGLCLAMRDIQAL